MADSGLVDSALMSVLASDATLLGFCPNGVYYGVAPPGSTAFVTVQLMDHVDPPGLDATTLLERGLYMVKAIILTSSSTPARQAADRIHDLLDQATLDLASAGYVPMVCRRIERYRTIEVDPVDKSARWQHQGGTYEVVSYEGS